MTWEFDEIVAGGQSDRYAMVQMFAPYGTLINDPKLSKTGGKWAWTTVPGPTSPEQGVTWIDGHNPRRAEIHQEQGMGAGVHPHGLRQAVAEAGDDPRQCAAAQFGAARPGDGRADRLAAGRGKGDRDRHSDAGAIRCGTHWRCSCAPGCRRRCWGRKRQSRRWTMWRPTGTAACAAPASAGDDGDAGPAPEAAAGWLAPPRERTTTSCRPRRGGRFGAS